MKAPSVPVSSRKKDEKEDENESQKDEERIEEDEVMQDAASDAEAEASEAPNRKRKRAAPDDLEDSYMRRLAKEEQKATEKRRAENEKRQRVKEEQDAEEKSTSASDDDDEEDEDEDDDYDDESGSTSEEEKKDASMPVHESQTGGNAESQEIEKSNRTVFLGNVASKAITSHSAKKTLLKHLESFLSTLPESSGPHKLESIRFRSTAFASRGKIPKRASFARREVMDETTPSTNAYAIYNTVQAARKAPSALNGTVVLDRHLRVDNIAHPAPTDNKRCIFVGNLDFVDQTTDPEEEEKRKKKNTAPADVEEGLWRTFNAETGKTKADPTTTKSTRGNVESVRVVRDAATRVGKGFAYVQFRDQNCVEEALLLDGKKFPPLLPRKLRVMRAKRVAKKREAPSNDKIADSRKTLQGRAGKLLGKAGQAQIKARDRGSVAQNSMVFEGVRATEGSQIKVKTKSRGSKAKKNNRSKQRAAAYRAAGGGKNKK